MNQGHMADISSECHRAENMGSVLLSSITFAKHHPALFLLFFFFFFFSTSLSFVGNQGN